MTDIPVATVAECERKMTVIKCESAAFLYRFSRVLSNSTRIRIVRFRNATGQKRFQERLSHRSIISMYNIGETYTYIMHR